ncbi:MAG: PspC domain-containing protein [Bacteroidales bacterium]
MEPQNRLYRSTRDSVIGGVCGGLGQYLNTDPILFRILFVLAVILGGSGILIYIILWIVVPINPNELYQKNQSFNTITNNMNEQANDFKPFEQGNEPPAPKQQKNDGNLWGGIILITLGGIFLIDRFVPRIEFGDLWPVILIVVGAILIAKAYQQNKP